MLDHPLRLGWPHWRSAFVGTYRAASAGGYGMVASSIAFYSFLAMLPSLAAVAFTYGIITPAARVVEDIGALIRILPGSARQFVGEWLVLSITRQEGRSLGLALSLVIALYAATRAGASIVAGLNVASDVEVGRSFLRKRAVSLLIVMVVAGLVFAALLALSALAFIERYAPQAFAAAAPLIRLVFWSLITAGATGALMFIYRRGPAREPPDWRWVAPGAICAMLLWTLGTVAFGFYLGSFGNYNRTYGSVGAVVILQIWLFFSALILILGARLNTEVQNCASRSGSGADASPGHELETGAS